MIERPVRYWCGRQTVTGTTPSGGPTPPRDHLRLQRVIEALERMDCREGRQLLDALSRGAAGAWLTQQAKAALQRFALNFLLRRMGLGGLKGGPARPQTEP